MTNDIKKYLSLGAVLAGSAFMVSCDGDDVTVVENTGVADAITDAIGDKPIAPIALAEYPLTSLKLAFASTQENCVSGIEFDAGDELELDFDATTIGTDASATTGDALADLNSDGATVFGVPFINFEGFVEGITNNTDNFTIDAVYRGTDNTGNLILSNLTFTPLASDARSVTGTFVGSTTTEVAFNQDDANVVVNVDNNGAQIGTLDTPGGSEAVVGVTIYEDDNNTGDVEVTNLGGGTVYETLLGDTNYGISVELADGCVVNFVADKDTIDALEGGDAADFVVANIQDLLDALDVTATLNVAPTATNEISANSAVLHLISGNVPGGVTGSYRHDFDSSIGQQEGGINSDVAPLQ